VIKAGGVIKASGDATSEAIELMAMIKLSER
jgi:hypothetical protein